VCPPKPFKTLYQPSELHTYGYCLYILVKKDTFKIIFTAKFEYLEILCKILYNFETCPSKQFVRLVYNLLHLPNVKMKTPNKKCNNQKRQNNILPLFQIKCIKTVNYLKSIRRKNLKKTKIMFHLVYLMICF
jgi:hypothetical protein